MTRGRRRSPVLSALVVTLAVLAACGVEGGADAAADAPGDGTRVETPPTTASTPAPDTDGSPGSVTPPTDPQATTTEAPDASSTTTVPPEHAGTEIAVVLDRRVDDADTAGFVATATAVLTDDRGWSRAGFRFRFADDAPYRVVLAEPAEVDELCAPYGTRGRYSCQIGHTVALNADRWRRGVDHWPGTIEEYRTMLVNHEVGHLLGQHHPATTCASPGDPAAVMAQQSKGLDGCAPTSWPLPWEVACAASGIEPLAPPYEPEAVPLCGPSGDAQPRSTRPR